MTTALVVSSLAGVWSAGVAGKESVHAGPGTVDCVIYPSAQANVGSSVPGVLLSIPVDRSDAVEQGQVLAVLESSAEQAAVELARARADAQSEINFRRIGAEHSNRQLSRLEELYRNKSISSQDLDDRKTETLLSQVQLQQARESKKILQLELARAQAILDRRTIRSPFSGVVVERVSSVGEFVDDQAVVRIAQLDPLHVETIVPGEYIQAISTGMSATVWSESSPNTQWTARVDRVDSVVDVASGTFGVRLELPNADRSIIAGLRCRLTFGDGGTLAHTSADHRSEHAVPTADHEISDQVIAGEGQRIAGQVIVGQAIAEKVIADTVTVEHHLQKVAEAAVSPGTEPLLGAAKPQGASVTGQDATSCISTGPYFEHDNALSAITRLGDDGVQSILDKRRVVRQVGHLVRSTTLSSSAEVDRYLALIKQQEIADYHIPSTPPPLKVSFGAFRREASATALHSMLSEKELTAEILPWNKKVDAYFLTIDGSAKKSTVLCD